MYWSYHSRIIYSSSLSLSLHTYICLIASKSRVAPIIHLRKLPYHLSMITFNCIWSTFDKYDKMATGSFYTLVISCSKIYEPVKYFSFRYNFSDESYMNIFVMLLLKNSPVWTHTEKSPQFDFHKSFLYSDFCLKATNTDTVSLLITVITYSKKVTRKLTVTKFPDW